MPPGVSFAAFTVIGESAQCKRMTNFTELVPAPAKPAAPFTDRLRLAVAAYLAASRAPPAGAPNPACAVTWPGAPSEA
jgi:hypothetical protein